MIWGIASAILALIGLIYLNWCRARLEEIRDLVPNCLLTTHPLLFIPGHRSLFYFLAYWNHIPHWLASHGYEVFHLQLPWKDRKQRKRVLRNFLRRKSQEQEKFHLFIDESSFLEMEEILEESSYECLASVTLIGHRQETHRSLTPRLQVAIEDILLPEPSKKHPLFWKLHQIWTKQNLCLHQLGWRLSPNQGLALLARARFLAERDLIQSQSSPSL